MSMSGKRALVTGGSAGLGAACVRWLQAHDFHVVSLDRNPPASTGNGQMSDADASQYIQCDLSDRAQLDAALGNIMAEGPFDLVVLNAGISATGRFEAISLNAHLDVLRVNTEAPMITAARLLEAQALRPGAAMVFVSSLSHFTGYPGAASYGASKDALAVFAKGMRKVAKARGVSITVAFPGPLRTDHAEQHAPKGADASKRMDPDKAAQAILTGTISGRKTVIPGLPNRIFAILGRIAPKPVTALMRQLIYKRLAP
ncbi:oxidoreductase, SDR subgroup 6 [Hoeflea phototrophica DFL-43]|jgi:short-subunit dehydrogenase|uniref:Oxidoreductase, SDR subgroup 6 n=1 Tax=Hoeflea phototrophica (strain DSM 17068 / NCIMB 14078 / DFL-43) TaxID=411684 RepID=A9D0E3_HOEPD|nr:SDR family NAD(P)-dependent oxidoreductase [Hoeflea phototrophica]EDQ34980.1 oxidoreductase, SDR subgroup 6 [Hoeflea phototrophica DFL-43]